MGSFGDDGKSKSGTWLQELTEPMETHSLGKSAVKTYVGPDS